MLKTLEQQQRKSTPNNEPHASGIETTPAASEEDDIEDHNKVFELEKKKKSNNSPLRELNFKNVTEQLDLRSPIENGRNAGEMEGSEENNSDLYKIPICVDQSVEQPGEDFVNSECIEDKKSIEDAGSQEKPSTSSDAHKSSTDIKIEKASPIPAVVVNDDDRHEPFSPGGKPCTSVNEQNEDIAIDTHANRLNAESAPLGNVKVESESPLPLCNSDESFIEQGTSRLESCQCEENIVNEISSPALKAVGKSLSQDVNVCPAINVVEKSPLRVEIDEEDRSSPSSSSSKTTSSSSSSSSKSISPALKIADNIKIEGTTNPLQQNNGERHARIDEDDEASSPVYKIVKDDLTSGANATNDGEPPSPAYNINNLSPASIPDEEFSQDLNAEIKIEETSSQLPKIPSQNVKMELDSEAVEEIEVKAENINNIEVNQSSANEIAVEAHREQSDNLKEKRSMKKPSLPPQKVKINGAHAAIEQLPFMAVKEADRRQKLEGQEEDGNEKEKQEGQREQEIEQEQNQEGQRRQGQYFEKEQKQEGHQDQGDKQEQHPLQQSVIINKNQEENMMEPHQPRSRSSTISSVSSTSQQLVIDQPESELQSKQKRHQPMEQANNQQMLHASKRRRSGSNSSSDNDGKGKKIPSFKEPCMEEPQQLQSSPLLLQRLQAPTINCNDMAQDLTCSNCKSNKFVSVQQLNTHYVQCKRQSKVAAAAEAVAAKTSMSAPAAVVSALKVAVPAPFTSSVQKTAATSAIKKERFFRCARCSTVHQCWNFFLHMREAHQRYICLYCSHVFASVEKLSLHLENKHDMDQRHFAGIEQWYALQKIEDRARYLVCCNCQTSFDRGTRFEDHDCTELMQPCALCGQKSTHANGCRNGNSINTNRKKTATRRKRKTTKSKPVAQLEEQTQAMEDQQAQQPKGKTTDAVMVAPQPMIQHNDNIPARVEEESREDPVPKLVVPKIMLRVPKEFQKSVDAALSSTDTEDEDNDELPTAGATEPAGTGETETCTATQLLTVDVVEQQQQQQQQLPMSSLSEDTETATETASTFQETTPTPAHDFLNQRDCGENASPSKLPFVLAEFERTKLDIQRAMALIVAKQEPQVPVDQLEQPELPSEVKQQRGRWSLTPPASPHNNHINETTHEPPQEQPQAELRSDPAAEPAPGEQLPPPVTQRRDTLGSECMDIDDSLNEQQQQSPQATEQSEQVQQSDQVQHSELEQTIIAKPQPPADGIEVASEDTHTVELQLDKPLDKFEIVDFVRLCLKVVYPFCMYCNHARRIAVNAKQLVLHLIAQHRFTATVDSITAEELQAETIVAKLKSYLTALENHDYLNSMSCCSIGGGRFVQPFNERIYECFHCRYVTATHKELYTHNRRQHIKANITCCMCRLSFFSFSELLCHICSGIAMGNAFDVQFRCCLCETAPLPSAFRLMVHLRKQHQACDICLEDCHTQAKLSAHVWKHKLLHLCYRCGIAYRNKQDISKHLFWKHGTESTGCKRCLQKRWRHVYHFCVPATQFTCEHCQFTFSKAIYLEVHKREHVGDFRYPCTEEQCQEKFVSRKLLLKHTAQHEIKQSAASEEAATDEKSNELNKLAKSEQDEQHPLSASTEQPKISEHQMQVKKEKDPDMSCSNSESMGQVDDKSAAKQIKDKTPPPTKQTEQMDEQTPRKRKKKTKRNKSSLEDLNLIAPNLSESDSSDGSDSDGCRSTATQHELSTHGTLPMRTSVDGLDMPRVMLSPASESDNEEPEKSKEVIKMETEPKQEQLESVEQPKEETDVVDAEKPKPDEVAAEPQEVPDIWKNLLQNQPNAMAKKECEIPSPVKPTEQEMRPAKLHVACSDHDYCKMQRTPPPKKSSHVMANKAKAGNVSSDSDSSSSSSSNSDSDSSSCSCGSNCSCSSSGSSSSDDDSDNASQSSRKTSKKTPKKSSERVQEPNHNEEYVNVTSNNEEEMRPVMPSPKAPVYNESDFDTAISDTDEEFYDAHPQRMASELLAEKRLALLSAHATQEQPHDGNDNYNIVENSRPSTPSLPEDATAYADKRERVTKAKKKKRERKSTCKSTSQAKLTANMPQMLQGALADAVSSPLLLQQHQVQQQQHIENLQQHKLLLQQQVQHKVILPESPLTSITQRPSWQPRMSEGSSCSDADGQLKRSKRTRRPNKFYGYTSDDENMSSVLAPPLLVGMQLIKPQPPPQLTWAKEDLPTPAKQQRSRSNHGSDHHHHQTHHHHHQQQQQNLHMHSNGSARKRNKRGSTGGAGSGNAKRGAKRIKQHAPNVKPSALPAVVEPTLPPIPTLKIRPALLPARAAGSDSSDSSSEDDENAEINVTSLLTTQVPIRAPPPPAVLPAVTAPPLPAPPPPPPATTAFNQPIPPALLPNPDFATLQYFKANNIRYPIRPPAGARLAREGESVYCYCRCPYDEVSEMIACDGDNCLIEWFHFECVGIMVAPQGKWFCAECRPKYSEGLYPGVTAK